MAELGEQTGAQGQDALAQVPEGGLDVPDVIQSFLQYFSMHFAEQNYYELQNICDNTFQQLTDRFYSSSPWPTAESIGDLVENDEVFLRFYREMYFRHIYSRLQPSFEQRKASWENYNALFSLLFDRDSADPLPVVVPVSWLWDIIDEFIYQFQEFRQYASKLKSKSDAEVEELKANAAVWNAPRVLEWLNTVVVKSEIIPHLTDADDAGCSGFGQSNTYRMLGYYAIIGLLRMHCLSGDYHTALKVLDAVDLSQKNGLFTSVVPCQTSLFYYTGFAYMMKRRYVDAIRVFSTVLSAITRADQANRTYLYDQIVKRSEQMCNLLAVCLSLTAQRFVDDSVQGLLRDKVGERWYRMQRGDIAAFEEAFSKGCPKFVHFSNANYDAEERLNTNLEPLKLQLRLFLKEVSQQLVLPTIRSYLKLYSTIPVSKLARFLEVEEEELRSHLYSYQYNTNSVVWEGGSALEGVASSSGDVEFYIEADMIHVKDVKVDKNYVGTFSRLISNFKGINSALDDPRKRPLRR